MRRRKLRVVEAFAEAVTEATPHVRWARKEGANGLPAFETDIAPTRGFLTAVPTPPRGIKDGLSCEGPEPPASIARTEEDIVSLLATAEAVAGVGRHVYKETGDPSHVNEHAEGFIAAVRWMRAEKDTSSVVLNWTGERGEMPF